ncbi:class I adenylate-forming enzyme family protein [Saccharothrix syringae]|uniref:Long-chain fatty acid--CoA ligase n=1 Tax=Saccharothrix syringae TaxID=103733 RepID=A0A5Q0H4P7_SACSY|nr:class I adenylate-forming enzyme family protein [Saccharothrix syringae]QFZ21221.1 long-chain fatty acid--CoA ligase [Saccharothrix syringae]
MTTGLAATGGAVAGPEWVDEVLLRGADGDVCLHAGGPVDRRALRSMVAERQERLTAAGLRPGGSLALRLPPSLAYVANLLAGWRAGAQVVLLDHRLTPYEVDLALERLAPQVVVAPGRVRSNPLRAFAEVEETVAPHPGRPAATPHAVIQLSSGSTGPSKVIGRTAADLVAEIDRYTRIDGVPLPGERIVVLASMVHVLGLVGALLYGLHAGVQVRPPERLTGDSVLEAVAAEATPATVLGVPFHIGLLASVVDPPALPQLKRMTTGGELVPAATAAAFTGKYRVPLGNMWGMTEVGVIATDLFGEHRPALTPAPGLEVVERGGELLVSRPESPYVGLADPTRWADGWLHTRDAGAVDPSTGLVTVKGRLDSQISVGGLKVDLTEVEATLGGLPGVVAAVVLHDEVVTAYAELAEPATAATVEAGLTERLAAYKRPRRLHVLPAMPRTTTGKLVRDPTVLRRAAREGK